MEPSSSALGICFGEMRDSVTDPVNPDPFGVRVIVEKLLPWNIQCHVPAKDCAASGDPVCRLVARANTASEPNVTLIASTSPIRLARDLPSLWVP
jgi:hypothetical protein